MGWEIYSKLKINFKTHWHKLENTAVWKVDVRDKDWLDKWRTKLPLGTWLF